MSRDYRISISPTYDSRETVERYHVTTRVGRRLIAFQDPVSDPFVRHTVTISLLDLLRGLFRGRLVVEVTVGADPDLMNDVLELDANTLSPGRSTRRDEFNAQIHEQLRDMT